MDKRIKRALEIIDNVSIAGKERWKVNRYTVTHVDGNFYCTCPYYTKTGKVCKHIIAVAFRELGEKLVQKFSAE